VVSGVSIVMVVISDWFRIRIIVRISTVIATATVTATEISKEDAVGILADCEIKKGKRDEKTR
jgi:hypothetical protein